MEKKIGQIKKFLTQNPRKLNMKLKLKVKSKKLMRRNRGKTKVRKKKKVSKKLQYSRALSVNCKPDGADGGMSSL